MLEYLNAIRPLNENDDHARLVRAEALGYDVTIKWYHGGFGYFKEFKDSDVGYHFAKDKRFAEAYAYDKSMHEEGDYDVIVRAFYLPKKLFDFRDKNHIKQLENILPNNLSIDGRYGWSAFGGSVNYDKETLLERIQGIATPFTGLSDELKHSIRNGADNFELHGGGCNVINYDKNTDTVEYVEFWKMQSINSVKYNIDYLKRADPENYRLKEYEDELKNKMKNLSTYKLQLSPKKKDGYDNWEILESPELRPYLEKLGFKGTIAQEKKHINCCIFDNRNIRSIDAAFNLDHKNSKDIMA